MNDVPPSATPPPPASAPKNKLVLVFGGFFAAVLVIGLVIGLVSSSGGPASATESFLEALRSGDDDKVKSLVCEGRSTSRSFMRSDDKSSVSWKVKSEKVDGDSAKVFLSLTVVQDEDSATTSLVASLKKEDNKWKICDVDKD